jgi:acetate kinase
MTDAVLALNAGSSSLKFALFEIAAGKPVLTLKGMLDERETETGLAAKDAADTVVWELRWEPGTPRDVLVGAVLDWIDGRMGTGKLLAAGHRVVHGGREF